MQAEVHAAQEAQLADDKRRLKQHVREQELSGEELVKQFRWVRGAGCWVLAGLRQRTARSCWTPPARQSSLGALRSVRLHRNLPDGGSPPPATTQPTLCP